MSSLVYLRKPQLTPTWGPRLFLELPAPVILRATNEFLSAVEENGCAAGGLIRLVVRCTSWCAHELVFSHVSGAMPLMCLVGARRARTLQAPCRMRALEKESAVLFFSVFCFLDVQGSPEETYSISALACGFHCRPWAVRILPSLPSSFTLGPSLPSCRGQKEGERSHIPCLLRVRRPTRCIAPLRTRWARTLLRFGDCDSPRASSAASSSSSTPLTTPNRL